MKILTQHDEIIEWAKQFKARPAVIESTGEINPDPIGIRFDFPGSSDEEFLDSDETDAVTWDKFFSIFEEQELAVEIYPENEGLDPTERYKLVKRTATKNTQ